MDYLISLMLTAILMAILHVASVWRSAKQGSGEVLLRSKTTHSNRTLQFTKGVVYKFYKVGNTLLILI
jgi:hypothetical protein